MTGAPTVLVVEDEPDLADLYGKWIRGRADVRIARDADEAQEALDPALDVVFLDRNLPGVSGDEVLGRIRDADFDCRVVMVTAIEPDFDILELGFDAYLTKPVTQEDLFDALDAMERREAYQDQLMELYALASKKAALETAKTDEELARSDEYRRLCEEFDRRRQEVATTLDEGSVDWATLLRDATLERSEPTGGKV